MSQKEGQLTCRDSYEHWIPLWEGTLSHKLQDIDVGLLTWSSMTVTHAWCSPIVTLSHTAWLWMLCKSINSSGILSPGCRCLSYCHKFKQSGLLKRTYGLSVISKENGLTKKPIWYQLFLLQKVLAITFSQSSMHPTLADWWEICHATHLPKLHW